MLIPTTITSKWQMTLPKSARIFFGVTRPGKVLLDVQEQEKVMRVLQSPSILDLAGTFTPKNKKKIMNAVKTRDYMEKHYERT